MKIIKKIVRYETEELSEEISKQIMKERLEKCINGNNFHFSSEEDQYGFAYYSLFGFPSSNNDDEKVESFTIVP